MFLKLFPQRPDHPLADAKELKRILAELHLDRAVSAVDEVKSWYESLKHAENFRVDQAFDVLRQLDDAAQAHLRRLTRDYLQSPSLSKIEEQRLWTRNYDYWRELAPLYSSCVERARLDPKGKGTEAFKSSLPLAMARLQAALGLQVQWLAYRYGLADGDLWRTLGQTYLEAHAQGVAQKPLQLYPSQRGQSSVAQLYLHALVFSTSSMDSLLPSQMAMANRLIAHFLPSFAFSSVCRADSAYWVDAATGAGPVRLIQHPGVASPAQRFVSFAGACTALEKVTDLVERGEVPTDVDLGGETSPRAVLPVLRHLCACWTLPPPQRHYQRHALKTRITVLHGFERSYMVFAGDLNTAQRDVTPESWVVENISLGGFRVSIDDATGDRIRIGAMLCARPEGSENWLLGVVRRFIRASGGGAYLGVQLLSRQAQSIELRPRRSGSSAAIPVPGMWLRDAGEPTIVRVVLPCGGFNVRETLEFSHDQRLETLTPLELEESTGDYEIGRFRGQSAM